MRTDHPIVIIVTGVITSLLVSLIERHYEAILIVMAVAIIAFVIGCGIPILANYLYSVGRLKNEFEVWLFIVLCIILVSLITGIIHYELTRDLIPVVHQYGPSEIHIDYK